MEDEVTVIQNHTYSTSVCPLVTKMKSFAVAVIIMPVLYGMLFLERLLTMFLLFSYTWNASSFFSPSAHLPYQP